MSSDDPLLGQTIRGDRILLEEVIGGGGMGRVYKGKDINLGRVVAVKVLLPEHQNRDTAKVYFEREARAASQLWHPNIIQIIDFGAEPDGTLCLVMEYIPGRNLADVIEDEFPLETTRIVRILVQLLTALEVAHQRGIVHRDLKPENIMLQDVPGNPDFVKVLDFGVAKAVERDAAGPMTMAGLVMGTPHFMSPEQALGQDIDARSDLYSVGAMLYQVLTTDLPFEGRMVMNVLAKVISEKPMPPIERCPDGGIDPRLEQICLLAMRKNPDGRFQSASEFREALLDLDRFSTGEEEEADYSEAESVDLQLFREQQRSAEREGVTGLSPTGIAEPIGGVRRAAVMGLDLRASSDDRFARAEIQWCFDVYASAVDDRGGVFLDGSVGLGVFEIDDVCTDPLRSAVEAAREVLSNLEDDVSVQAAFGLAWGIVEVDDTGGYLNVDVLERSVQVARAAQSNQILADQTILDGDTSIEVSETRSPGLFLVRDDVAEVEVEEAPAVLQGAFPLLDRESQVQALGSLLRRIVAGQGAALAIHGPEGCGKTRLLNLVAGSASSNKISVLRASAESFEGQLPGLPLTRLARQALQALKVNDILQADSLKLSEEQVQTLSYLLKEMPPPGFSRHWSDVLTVSLVGLLRQLCSRAPVVVLMDNFESIDMLSFNVVLSLGEALKEDHFALIVAGESESDTVQTFVESFRGMSLPPLPDSVLHDFFEEQMPRMPGDVKLGVIRLTRGIAANFEELVNYVRRYEPRSAAQLPQDPAEVLFARLESLPESARKLSTIAGALGQSFPLDALAGSCPKSWDLRGSLRTIGEALLLSLQEDESRAWLRFEPAPMAEVALAQVPEETRSAIHERVAAYFERTYKDNAHPDYQFQWARQLFLAGRGEEALEVFRGTVSNSLKVYGAFATLPVVNEVLNAAYEVLDPTSRGFKVMLIQATEIMIEAGFYEDALELLVPAKNAFGSEMKLTLEYYTKLGRCLLVVDRHKEAARVLRHVIKLSNGEEPLLIAQAHQHLATLYERRRALKEASEEAKKCIRIVHGLDTQLPKRFRRLSWQPLLLLSHLQVHLKQWEKAVKYQRHALRAAAEQRCVEGRVQSNYNLAVSEKHLEHFNESQEAYLECIKATWANGDVNTRIRALHEVGLLCLKQGEREPARGHFSASYELARNAGASEMVRYNEMWLRKLASS